MMAMIDNNFLNHQSQQALQNKQFQPVLTSYTPFLNNPLLSDVTFLIQNQKFFAHKLVLAARSPYFYSLITHNSQSTVNTLEIEIQDASAAVFIQVLQWMYSGAVNWNEYLQNEAKIINKNQTPSIVWDLYQAAQFYQVKPLCDTCELKIINQLNRENVFQNWKQAQVYNAQNTLNYCVDYVKMEFAKELQHISASFYLPHSDPFQLQKQIFSIIQQNVLKGDSSEIYNSLQQYTFPYKAEQVKKEPTEGRAPTSTTPRGSASRRSVAFSDQIQVNDVTGAKTEIMKFDMWNKNATPPPAYPTPESLAAFPQFFNMNNAPPTPNTPETGRKLCRRLSVMNGSSTRGVFLQHLISGLGKLLSAERASLFLLMSEEVYSQVALGEKAGNSNERHVMCCPVFGHRGSITGVLEIINGTPSGESHLRTVALLISLFLQETGITAPQPQQQQQSQQQPQPQQQPQSQQQSSAQSQQKQARPPQQQSALDNPLADRSTPLFTDPITSLAQPLSLTSTSYRRQSVANLQKLGEESTNGNEFSLFWDNDDDVTLGDWNVEDFLRDEDVLNLDKSNQLQTTTDVSLGATRQSSGSILDDLTAGRDLDHPNSKKRKRSNSQSNIQPVVGSASQSNDPHVPFMHFRIPRYELQFIQFEGGAMKKKKSNDTRK